MKIRKRAVKKVSLAMGLLLLLWIIVAQGCMKFRVSDAEARKQFSSGGMELKIFTETYGRQHLHYAMTGADTLHSILFVHGSPGSWNAFARYMQDSLLRAKYRMISVDRPGFGYSDFGRPQHIEAQSAILTQLLKKLWNGQPVYLVGHSLGGPVIVQLYADNPGMISGLVLLAASVDPAEETREYWRYIMNGDLLQYLMPGAFRPSNRELVYFKKDVYGVAEKLVLVKGRVFIVHGTADTFVPPGNAYYAVSKLVNAAVIDTTFIPGANHFIPWQHFETIRNILLRMDAQ